MSLIHGDRELLHKMASQVREYRFSLAQEAEEKVERYEVCKTDPPDSGLKPFAGDPDSLPQ